MKQVEEKIVLDTDDEAAKLVTVTGWVSRDGRFYGKDENLARYAGCTHKKCECGNLMTKGYLKCNECINKGIVDRYNKMPFKEWDRVTPLCLHDGDNKFFFSEDDIIEYCEEEDIKPEDLKLVIASPNYLHEISTDIWEDVLCEDQELPKELQELVDKANEWISNAKPISWGDGKYRTQYKPTNKELQ